MSPLNPLNPDAGNVPVPEDRREIAAALRAGSISTRIYPYVDWRYGERGRKFTSSDSAWLAWLTRHEQPRVCEQIMWLRSVLSNRGMPSSILETHLRVLFRQLVRVVPEKEPQYRSLEAVAQRLRQARDQQVSPVRAEQLVADFVVAIGDGPRWLLSGVGRLLVASVADRKLGESKAVSSLESWLVEPEHWRDLAPLRARLPVRSRRWIDSASFAPRWRAALQATIAQTS